KSLRNIERETVAKILRHLLTVESEGIHLEMSYSSLFEFCMKELDYSEDEAVIRIRAMRLMKSVPSIESKIESGELSLSVLAKAQSAFRKEEQNKRPVPLEQKEEIIFQLAGSSVRKAERELATIFPETSFSHDKIKPITERLDEYRFTGDK